MLHKSKIFLLGVLILSAMGVYELKPALHLPSLTSVIFNAPDDSLNSEIKTGGKLLGGSEELQAVTSKLRSSIVVIQSFTTGSLLHTGNGLVLTRDGLVITLNTLVPTAADFYQIFVEGVPYRGRVVARSYGDNLALIALEEDGLIPATFSSEREASFIMGESRNLDRMVLEFHMLEILSRAPNGVNLLGMTALAPDHSVVGIIGANRQVISVDKIENLFLVYTSKP